MVSRSTIFWGVDVQSDFMLPGGKLYVPGAEKLLPNINRLAEAARAGRVFLVSSACSHAPDDPEFQRFPPHCIRGTAGAAVVPQAQARQVAVIPNRRGAGMPTDFSAIQQVILEKQSLDVFESANAEAVVEQLKIITDPDAEFVVFGVVTEYCVSCAARGLLERGRRVALVSDAIETLDTAEGKKTLDELKAMGARLITTDQALAQVGALPKS